MAPIYKGDIQRFRRVNSTEGRFYSDTSVPVLAHRDSNHGNANPFVHAPLLGVSRNRTLPRERDNRAWVRQPAKLQILLYRFIRMNYCSNLFLLCLPMGIVASRGKWEPGLVFILNAISLIPLTLLTSECLQYLGPKMNVWLCAVLPNLVHETPLLALCIRALSKEDQKFVQEVLIGVVACRGLLGLGSGLLFSGIRKPERRVHQMNLSTVLNMGLLLGLGLFPFLASAICNDSNYSNRGRVVLSISRLSALILISAYCGFELFYICQVYDNLFEPVNAPTNPPGSLLKTLAVITLCCFCMSGSIACAVCIYSQVESMYRIYTLNTPFISTVLVPVALKIVDNISIAVSCREKRYAEVLSVVHEGGLEVILLINPCLIILAWIIKQSLSMLVSAWKLAMLAFGALVPCLVFADGRASYLRGLTLLAMYALLVVVAYSLEE